MSPEDAELMLMSLPMSEVLPHMNLPSELHYLIPLCAPRVVRRVLEPLLQAEHSIAARQARLRRVIKLVRRQLHLRSNREEGRNPKRHRLIRGLVVAPELNYLSADTNDKTMVALGLDLARNACVRLHHVGEGAYIFGYRASNLTEALAGLRDALNVAAMDRIPGTTTAGDRMLLAMLNTKLTL